jgi:Protein of unknown function (DUF2380)
MLRTLAALILSLAAAPATAQDAWQGQKAAFFGVTFLDTSIEGELNGSRADETARVALVEDYIAHTLVEHGLELVDLAPVENVLRLIANPADCNGCDARMADRLGARYAIVSEVQKVSNLILSMNVVVRDANTGAMLRGMAVDIRGNTDESWLRGMRSVLTHGIFTD